MSLIFYYNDVIKHDKNQNLHKQTNKKNPSHLIICSSVIYFISHNNDIYIYIYIKNQILEISIL